MRPLSGLDASFLYAETPAAPMHVGSLTLLQPASGHALDFAALKRFVASRLGRVRATRERLVEVPFGLGAPYWIETPDFQLGLHVHHVALPAPRGMKELTELVTQIFTPPLDRSRPLWDMTVVEGLAGIAGLGDGAFGIITKVHHAAIDGVSGATMLAAFLDTSPQIAPLPEVLPTWPGEPIPTPFELLGMAAREAVRTPDKLVRLVPKLARAASRTVATREQAVPLPIGALEAPRTRFNGPLARQRAWAWVELDLARVRRVKAAHGVSLNDVVVATCAGALRELLSELGELPEAPLVAFLPVNVRQPADREAGGNHVSAMRASLATDEPDPALRLQKIHASTTRSKIYHQAAGASTAAEVSELVPYALGSLAAYLYVEFAGSRFVPSMFNTIITNVPGPQIPLYLNGSRVVSTIGIAPINEGVGLIHTVFSFNGRVTIGVCTAREWIPDLDRYLGRLRTAFEELEAAVPAPAISFPTAPDA